MAPGKLPAKSRRRVSRPGHLIRKLRPGRSGRIAVTAALVGVVTATGLSLNPRGTGAETPEVVGELHLAEAPTREGSLEVLYEAYRHIRQRYVRGVPMARIAQRSLAGLTTLDPAVKTAVSTRQIIVSYRGRAISRLDAPPAGRIYRWAQAVQRAVESARQASPKVRAADSEALFEALLRGVTGSLDRYSRYATAAEARNRRALQEGYTGIGISVRDDKGTTRVVVVMPESPAERAGLKTEDGIVGIEGKNAVGIGLPKVVKQLRGPQGTSVRITIERKKPAVRRFDVTVKRDRINPHTVVYKREGRIAYIRLLRFSGNTTSDLIRAVRRARAEIGNDLAGIILDLRNNPGGYLDQANSVSDVFLNRGRIVSTRGRHPRSRRVYWARPGDVSRGAPVVILVNGNSASSAEIVSGALQDNGRAIIIGSVSFGKGTVQSVAPLPNGGEMIITWSRFHAPSGYALETLGVLPNICTSRRTRNAAVAINRVQREKTLTRYYFRTWRLRTTPSKRLSTRLRKLCPPERASVSPDKDLTMETAKRVLLTRGLYQKALRLGGVQSAKLR